MSDSRGRSFRPSYNPGELKRLLDLLVDAESAVAAALPQNIDAVVHATGHSYLLREAQQALLQSEARAKEQAAVLRAIVDNAPDFITYLGVDGRIRYVNRVTPELNLERVNGADWFSLQPDEHREELRKVFEGVVATGRPASYDHPRTEDDGTRRYYARRFGAVQQDGEVRAVVLITRDITERQHLEDATREAKAFAESILATVQEPLVVLDDQLQIVSANLAFVTTFQLPAEGVPGKQFHELIEGWNTDEFAEILNSVIGKGLEVNDYEVDYLSPSNGSRTMLVNARCVQRPDGAKRLMLVGLRDATDRDEHIRLLERQKQLEAVNQELDAFAYSVSHDLRAPLRAINGFSRILSEDYGPSLPADAQENIAFITASAARMAQLIDDLLNFARLGRIVPELRAVDMRSLVEPLVQARQAADRERVVDIQIDELPNASCDPNLLQQVWGNFIDNAFKYTRKRERARIRIAGREDGDDVVYSIEDNGAGFDMKDADRLFGAFQRLHSDDEFEGTGVGLSLVRRLVQRHGGRTWAEATTDVGATFFFSLPRR